MNITNHPLIVHHLCLTINFKLPHDISMKPQIDREPPKIYEYNQLSNNSKSTICAS